jgi:predicted nuclease of predicted toxin-antitoxin system
MKILCDTNIPPGLVSTLQQEFQVAEVSNILNGSPSRQDRCNLANKRNEVLLTATNFYLQNGCSHGVILYTDPSAKDSQIASIIKSLEKTYNPDNIKHEVPP